MKERRTYERSENIWKNVELWKIGEQMKEHRTYERLSKIWKIVADMKEIEDIFNFNNLF